jgi:hypothetical protein
VAWSLLTAGLLVIDSLNSNKLVVLPKDFLRYGIANFFKISVHYTGASPIKYNPLDRVLVIILLSDYSSGYLSVISFYNCFAFFLLNTGLTIK